MGLGDRIRGFFARRANPALGELDSFLESRKGVEGFIEPQTATHPASLLLVDRNGEHLRAPIRGPEDAFSFGARRSIPIYEAQVVGYPKRMKEFEKRRRTEAFEDLDASFAELERRLAETPDEPTD